jgi:hypothetical protein
MDALQIKVFYRFFLQGDARGALCQCRFDSGRVSLVIFLIRSRVVSSPNRLEKAHEPSGQVILGRSAKNLRLWPKYSK